MGQGRGALVATETPAVMASRDGRVLWFEWWEVENWRGRNTSRDGITVRAQRGGSPGGWVGHGWVCVPARGVAAPKGEGGGLRQLRTGKQTGICCRR